MRIIGMIARTRRIGYLGVSRVDSEGLKSYGYARFREA